MIEILFRLGMWWRIIYGIFKFFLGVILLNFVHSNFSDLFYKLMSHELIQDPNDIFVNTLGFLINKHPFNITYFLAIYFIFWGALDTFLSINLLRLKLWSYPVSLVLISFFTLYEIYRFTHTHSVILLSIIFIDIFILWIINKEYKKN